MEGNSGITHTVISAAEIRRGWGKVKTTVDRAFWSGKIQGRRVDDRGTYIYDLASVRELWGEPKCSPFINE